MTKEQQDISWACLSKEVRKDIRDIYSINLRDHSHYSDIGVWNEASACFTKFKLLEDLYGKHNLTSDTEPGEMLMVPRKRVQEMAQNDIVRGILISLFSDKCLPDKEPSAQVEPKFPIGSIVRITNKKNPYHGHKGKFGKVITYNAKFNRYAIEGIPSEWDEGDLEPYTEEIETMEEKELWGAELGEYYFYLDECLNIQKDVESGNYKDNILWSVRNYFRTYDKAAEASYSIRECFKTIHEVI